MEPTQAQRTPLPNSIGGGADYFLRATIDPKHYQDLTNGRSTTVLLDTFCVKAEINSYFIVFQYVANVRNQEGNFFMDVMVNPMNRGLIHLQATVKVSNIICQAFTKILKRLCLQWLLSFLLIVSFFVEKHIQKLQP